MGEIPVSRRKRLPNVWPELAAAGIPPTKNILAELSRPSARLNALVEPTNIDLYNRPQVAMPDGSYATIRSAGFNLDGREVLLPTVSPDGRLLSDDEAVELYRRTGKHLGIYGTPEASEAYGRFLSQQQGRIYGKGRKP